MTNIVGRDNRFDSLGLRREHHIAIEYSRIRGGLPTVSCLSPKLGRSKHRRGGKWNVSQLLLQSIESFDASRETRADQLAAYFIVSDFRHEDSYSGLKQTSEPG